MEPRLKILRQEPMNILNQGVVDDRIPYFTVIPEVRDTKWNNKECSGSRLEPNNTH